MKKAEKIFIVIAIIAVITSILFIIKVNISANTRLVETLDIYVEDEFLNKTKLGTSIWNNPTTNLFKKNYREECVPANVLLEETLEIEVKVGDNIKLKLDPKKYNIDNYKMEKDVNIIYTIQTGKEVYKEKVNSINNEIEFKIPNIEGIHYLSIETNYKEKGTVYNYTKFKIKK